MTEQFKPNRMQLEAVMHDGSAAVLAGPGSGKTETIAFKVAHLLSLGRLPKARGVACITYSNDAASELRSRINQYESIQNTRLFTGTVHSFCLRRILRPFAHLCGAPELREATVVSEAEQYRLIQQAIDQVGLQEQASYFATRLNVVRRTLACREPIDNVDERYIEAAKLYDQMLSTMNAVDFEAMTLRSLELLSLNPDVAKLISARFPWIAVDEYQDLGGPLHHLVGLLKGGEAKIFAVGDPDQCVFGFTGAKPQYLRELASQPDVEPFELEINYRSGEGLISAATSLLDTPRPYRAHAETPDHGRIEVHPVAGDLTNQARYVACSLIPSLLSDGIAPDQIAVLYNRTGQLVEDLLKNLEVATFDFNYERDDRFPSSPLTRWLQSCARRAVDPADGPSIAEILHTCPIESLRPDPLRQSIALRRAVMTALKPATADMAAHHWLADFGCSLEIEDHLRAEADERELEALSKMLTAANPPVGLREFALGPESTGKVALTTCHGSKGRQFEVVVVVGLQQHLFPFEPWFNGRNRAVDLEGDRRLFYVAVTRAKSQVILTHSDYYLNKIGQPVSGRSAFIDELVQNESATVLPTIQA